MKKLNMLFVLLLCVWISNIFAILDCDYKRDCRGLGANYFCNSMNQCEEGGADEFTGEEGVNGGCDSCN